METFLLVAASVFLAAALAEVAAAWRGRPGPLGLQGRLQAGTALAVAVFLVLTNLEDEVPAALPALAGLLVLVLLAVVSARALRARRVRA